MSGEDHYFLGQRYRLQVITKNEPAKILLSGKNKILLQVRPETTPERREEIMLDWYRDELRGIAGALLEKWQDKIDVHISSWGIKRMKTRWGTCNQKTGRIWLNLELIKKPKDSI